jgi:predicted DNA-binding protein with PD1-like motif
MVSVQESNVVRTLVARMSPGEDVLETLESLVTRYDVRAGCFSLIGAIASATLGYFDVNAKMYRVLTLKQDLEVTSCTGNISRLEDGTPVIHAHMVVANEKGESFSGHLMKGCRVSVTIEVVLNVLDGSLVRVRDDKMGLNLLRLH